MSFYGVHVHVYVLIDFVSHCSKRSLLYVPLFSPLFPAGGRGDANVVVFIASGAVAGTLILVILIVSIILIFICVNNLRQRDTVDLPDLGKDSSWMGQGKRNSSSLSSDSNELSNLGPVSSRGDSRPVAQHSSNGADVKINLEGSRV